MMESSSLEEKNIIKNTRNLFRLEEKPKAIKEQMLKDIKEFF